MIKILVYNNNLDRMEKYYRELSDSMPYNANRTLTVNEFRSNSTASTIWTSTLTMTAWNSFRYIYGNPIFVGFAFKRPWEGGHSNLSQHYAGTAFDVGQNLSYSNRVAMRNLAANSRIWNYVEPISDTPRWVHFDERTTFAGYPTIRYGSKSNYVCIAQDALNALGYSTGGLDGIFGNQTRNSTINFQNANGLVADGIIGKNTWNKLMGQVNGIGKVGKVEN